jgi:hypothetical protein
LLHANFDKLGVPTARNRSAVKDERESGCVAALKLVERLSDV